MSGVEERRAEVLAAHWSYEPTQDYDGWLCECGTKIADRDVGDLDVAMQAHVAAALAPIIAAERAAAWDEGYTARRGEDHLSPGESNPYREAWLCHEFIDTGKCGHSDVEHDALAAPTQPEEARDV